MTLLYYDPRFLEHDTGRHPECAERLRHVTAHLAETGLEQRCRRPKWTEASEGQIAGVHSDEHVAGLRRLADRGGGLADADTVVSSVSVDVAKLAAGAICDAVSRVLEGEDNRGFCLVRPPGHHALAERAMGFCLLNNVAIAARAALEQGVDRLLIVDWDVHHGNGTQAIFYDDPRVGFFSAHRWPFYPGTGLADETGAGDGLGTTRNLPLPFGTTRKDYQSSVSRELEDFSKRMKPDLVLISAGFDSHHSDPIGSLGLEVEDFAQLTATVVEVAAQFADGRIVSTLEGGYNPPILAKCVAAHLQSLMADP